MLTANMAWNLAHFRAPLISALSVGGHEIVALSPVDHGVDALNAAGVRHVPLALDQKGTSPFKDAQLMRAMARAFGAEAPDIVLSFTIKNNIYGAFAARRAGVPFLPNVSGLGTAFLNAGWLERITVELYRNAFRPLPTVFFQNPDDAELFLSRGMVRPSQVAVLPGSGIDLARYAPVPAPGDEGPVFLLIARLLRDKGVGEFVEAARKLRAALPSARFQLLGPAGAENRTAIPEAEVQGWVAEGLIEYLGETDDVRPFIAAADCVVLPSYREGTPRTLLEGAAMARPLVATDVPGCREVIEAGVNGYLCPARSAEGLADALLRVARDGAARQVEMGAAGRRIVEARFDQAIVVRHYFHAIAALTADASDTRQAG
ncbi:MAG: glycosyltransferase family 4 protein [Pseudomonadota bacterium]